MKQKVKGNMTTFKEHSNFVRTLVNYQNGTFRGTGTRDATRPNETKRKFTISTRVEEVTEDPRIIKMIESQEKLATRLDEVLLKLENLKNERDALKAEVDRFRLIGLSDNPTLEDGTISELWLAEHKQSIADTTIEERIKLVKIHQKILEIYTLSIRLDQSKVQIKSDISTRREIQQNQTTKEIKESRNAEKKKRFSSYYKAVSGTMKSGITEAQAVAGLLQMGVKIPEGYVEICGESFKKELEKLVKEGK